MEKLSGGDVLIRVAQTMGMSLFYSFFRAHARNHTDIDDYDEDATTTHIKDTEDGVFVSKVLLGAAAFRLAAKEGFSFDVEDLVEAVNTLSDSSNPEAILKNLENRVLDLSQPRMT